MVKEVGNPGLLVKAAPLWLRVLGGWPDLAQMPREGFPLGHSPPAPTGLPVTG